MAVPANFITAPVLALIIGPREGVPIIILLNLVSNIQVMPGALPHTNWRRMLPVGIAAIVMAPLGAWILFVIEKSNEADRRRHLYCPFASTAVRLAIPWAARIAYPCWCRRPWRIGDRFCIDGRAAGVSVPAVRAWQCGITTGRLSGVRANGSTGRNRVICNIGLITLELLLLASILFIPFTLACWTGMRLFAKASDTQFRNYTLWGIAILSLVIAVV